MGQAKLRGTYEQRKEVAIMMNELKEKRKEMLRQKAYEEQRQWDLDNPRQAERVKTNKRLMASLIALGHTVNIRGE